MSNQELLEPSQEEIQLDINKAEDMIRIYDAYMRLKNNPDFQLVFEEQYLKQNALDSMSLLSHEQMVQQRPMIMEDLISVSNLINYLLRIERLGEKVKSDLAELRELEMEETSEEG